MIKNNKKIEIFLNKTNDKKIFDIKLNDLIEKMLIINDYLQKSLKMRRI